MIYLRNVNGDIQATVSDQFGHEFVCSEEEWKNAGYSAHFEDGQIVLGGKPKTRERIRAERKLLMENLADPLKYDYEEAAANGEEGVEALKEKWLIQKQKIRDENPYPVESV